MTQKKVTSANVRRANQRLTGEERPVPKDRFVPSHKLPRFEYDKEKSNAAWKKALAACT